MWIIVRWRCHGGDGLLFSQRVWCWLSCGMRKRLLRLRQVQRVNTTIVRNYLWDVGRLILTSIHEALGRSFSGFELPYVMFFHSGGVVLKSCQYFTRHARLRASASNANPFKSVFDWRGVRRSAKLKKSFPVFRCSDNVRYPILGASWQPRAKVWHVMMRWRGVLLVVADCTRCGFDSSKPKWRFFFFLFEIFYWRRTVVGVRYRRNTRRNSVPVKSVVVVVGNSSL